MYYRRKIKNLLAAERLISGSPLELLIRNKPDPSINFEGELRAVAAILISSIKIFSRPQGDTLYDDGKEARDVKTRDSVSRDPSERRRCLLRKSLLPKILSTRQVSSNLIRREIMISNLSNLPHRVAQGRLSSPRTPTWNFVRAGELDRWHFVSILSFQRRVRLAGADRQARANERRRDDEAPAGKLQMNHKTVAGGGANLPRRLTEGET